MFVECFLPSVILDKVFAKDKISFVECIGHSTKKTSMLVVKCQFVGH